MQKKHLDTIRKVFERPDRADIIWRHVESMLQALGAHITEGSGSRVRINLRGVRAVFHEPHPGKEMDKGAVKSMRKFLIHSGTVDENGGLVLAAAEE